MLALRIPPSVVVGLGLTIVLDTGVQILWKVAVLQVASSATFLEVALGTLAQPLFYAVVAMFMLQFVIWMKVLARADLSFAQPITALSLVSVCAISAFWLNEDIGSLRQLGIGLILLGTYFISQTNHNTLDDLKDAELSMPFNKEESLPVDEELLNIVSGADIAVGSAQKMDCIDRKLSLCHKSGSLPKKPRNDFCREQKQSTPKAEENGARIPAGMGGIK